MAPKSPLPEAEDSYFGEDVDKVAVAETFVLVRALPPPVSGGSV